jgi:hypothetical protein
MPVLAKDTSQGRETRGNSMFMAVLTYASSPPPPPPAPPRPAAAPAGRQSVHYGSVVKARGGEVPIAPI